MKTSLFKKILFVLILLPFLCVVGVLVFLKIYGKQITEGAVATVGRNVIVPALNLGLLSQLFAPSFTNQEEAMKYIEELRKRNFTQKEAGMLFRFLNIKNELTAYKRRTGQLPGTLAELGLSRERVTDENGFFFRYRAEGKYVLLGSPGKDTTWNIADSTKRQILNNKSEFVFKRNDDFIVKIVVDTVQDPTALKQGASALSF